MSDPPKRKRSRVACDPCRNLKRKCDGAAPCTPCLRFEYDCTYQQTATRRKRTHPEPDAAPSPASPSVARPSVVHPSAVAATPPGPVSSLEANSGPAFVRRLALAIDPNNAPRMHMFAWNVFLGARDAVYTPESTHQPVTDIISQREMEALTDAYFQKFDFVYGFIDRRDLERHIGTRWQNSSANSTQYDAVLCGVAAIGSLFSNLQPTATEHRLVQSARALLQQSLTQIPTTSIVTAWVLRTSYLKLTGTPHEAWMASCTTMHMVEAAGLHCEPRTDSVLPLPSHDVDPELRRRIFGVAQHLNIWMSYDLGRSRVSLHKATTLLPSPRPGRDITVELLELLPYSAMLDPERASTAAELESALLSVLDRTHTAPPSQMAQCNLVLCICRRLQSFNISLSGSSYHDKLLTQIRSGIRAAETLLEARMPWHHMANVPFSVICVLLAMDTLSSLAQLPDAMQSLSRIAQTYSTEATREALETASLLIYLYQKRKEKCTARLNEVLRLYPVRNVTEAGGADATRSQASEDMGWLNDLVAEIPNLQDFDVDQFLNLGSVFDGNVI
ncbi:hypothetical protein CONLIGDRAFT_635152 [Coniochaeta ligniaria NRRL 30616]|uniref:Zn(2)-C6 fungal-type domain-containing protein n=1 Tax=Coniochaeta ligniaria NRRL 30616 TaxID=1408157 RepID=A0A1J7IHJ0_9PEZI|nr:hypothetical protein CONLIGDRAFT_635152 [Coniochaeta ligniaria NRRL 30616]